MEISIGKLVVRSLLTNKVKFVSFFFRGASDMSLRNYEVFVQIIPAEVDLTFTLPKDVTIYSSHG